MAFATTHCVALDGARGHLIDVQADVSSGQPGVVVVGRADAALREGLDRVRMAIVNSDLKWPAAQRTTILLSPADLPKGGTHFDLAMAVSVLAATRQVEHAQVAATAFIGELTLAGGLRPAVGVLPMVMAAAARGVRRVVVPEPQVGEAQMVPDMVVIGLRSLAQVVAVLVGELPPEAPPVASASGTHLVHWRGADRLDDLDFSDLRGMLDEKYAAEVAAAGGHALMLSGAKGCGKTSLAERLPTVLPDLTVEESLELTALHSLAGALDPADGMIVRPPFAAPHHDASKVSIIGGGQGRVHPGEISRAHCGVLFLDEFPLFRADVIEGLRQPMESGEIAVARLDESVCLPARGMVVLAANPCPCGDFHPQAVHNKCQCHERQRRDYRRKVTGPVTDRIDIMRHLTPVGPHHGTDRFAVPESSAEVRARVEAARQRQAERYAGCSWRLNSQAPGPVLTEEWPLSDSARRIVDDAVYSGRLTRRGAARVHRLAWTVADLGGVERPGDDEVDVALRLRTGEPLLLATLERRAG
ncbi:MAG TPA: YifB family Mg chelatase-like AAA ATPase [Nocardioides sp.]|nr:YifB family Mg chelatase-like AAA ATPase [Nocardioides sp.]